VWGLFVIRARDTILTTGLEQVDQLPLETLPALLAQLAAEQARLAAVQGALAARLIGAPAAPAHVAPGTAPPSAGSPETGTEGSLTVDEAYLSIRQLASYIPYRPKSIRNLMTQGVFRDGEHYFKRRGRVMFSRRAVRAWVEARADATLPAPPLVRTRDRDGRPR
jgi:hypothetical protein